MPQVILVADLVTHYLVVTKPLVSTLRTNLEDNLYTAGATQCR